MAKQKIKYATKSVLDADEFDSKYCKIRISMMIDEDVLLAFKARAAKERAKYQTLINQVLREAIFGSDLDSKIRTIVREELKRGA